MKVLITGAEGQVAHDLLRCVDNKKFTPVAFAKSNLDITDAKRVKAVIDETNPGIVINAAAYTKVDQAEEDVTLAFAVNRDGPKNLAIACQSKKIPLLHLSTDYIFDGNKNSPYTEKDAHGPLNIYGQSKWEGEEAIRQYCEQYIILRVSAVFGAQGLNFVKTMMRLAQAQETLRIVADQVVCPTSAEAIANALWSLCSATKLHPAWGTYHFCGGLPTTWYDFANIIITETKKHLPTRVKQLDAIASKDFLVKAKRPHYSVLDGQLLQQTFGLTEANWQHHLVNLVSQLAAQGA